MRAGLTSVIIGPKHLVCAVLHVQAKENQQQFYGKGTRCNSESGVTQMLMPSLLYVLFLEVLLVSGCPDPRNTAWNRPGTRVKRALLKRSMPAITVDTSRAFFPQRQEESREVIFYLELPLSFRLERSLATSPLSLSLSHGRVWGGCGQKL